MIVIRFQFEFDSIILHFGPLSGSLDSLWNLSYICGWLRPLDHFWRFFEIFCQSRNTKISQNTMWYTVLTLLGSVCMCDIFWFVVKFNTKICLNSPTKTAASHTFLATGTSMRSCESFRSLSSCEKVISSAKVIDKTMMIEKESVWKKFLILRNSSCHNFRWQNL